MDKAGGRLALLIGMEPEHPLVAHIRESVIGEDHVMATPMDPVG